MGSTAIFLSGPIGAGKSTLGVALAQARRGTFIEGDEHSAPDRPWYASTLTTARSIVRAIVRDAEPDRPVVIAYPLRCLEWIFYRRHLEKSGIRMIVVSLGASYDSTTSADRGRRFSEGEQDRIRQMIAEGYDRRRFSDLVLRTDDENRDETLGRLLKELPNIERG